MRSREPLRAAVPDALHEDRRDLEQQEHECVHRHGERDFPQRGLPVPAPRHERVPEVPRAADVGHEADQARRVEQETRDERGAHHRVQLPEAEHPAGDTDREAAGPERGERHDIERLPDAPRVLVGRTHVWSESAEEPRDAEERADADEQEKHQELPGEHAPPEDRDTALPDVDRRVPGNLRGRHSWSPQAFLGLDALRLLVVLLPAFLDHGEHGEIGRGRRDHPLGHDVVQARVVGNGARPQLRQPDLFKRHVAEVEDLEPACLGLAVHAVLEVLARVLRDATFRRGDQVRPPAEDDRMRRADPGARRLALLVEQVPAHLALDDARVEAVPLELRDPVRTRHLAVSGSRCSGRRPTRRSRARPCTARRTDSPTRRRRRRSACTASSRTRTAGRRPLRTA